MKNKLSEMTKKQKIVAAIVAAVLVVGSILVGTFVYTNNTAKSCDNATAEFNQALTHLKASHDKADEAIKMAADLEANEYLVGFATPEPTVEGNALAGTPAIEAVNQAKTENPLKDKPATCDSRDVANAISADAAAMETGAKAVEDATAKLTEAMNEYATNKMIEVAKTKLSEAVANRQSAIEAANAALKSAEVEGFTANADNKALVDAVKAKLDAANQVATTPEPVDADTAKTGLENVTKLDTATAELKAATAKLTETVNAYNAAKAAEAKAAAEKAAAQKAKANQRSNRSYKKSSKTNKHRAPAKRSNKRKASTHKKSSGGSSGRSDGLDQSWDDFVKQLKKDSEHCMADISKCS